MTTDLKAKLLRWLETSGHAFELRVAKNFQGPGWVDWLITQSRYYEDPATQTQREIDLTISYIPDTAQWLDFVVECKKTEARPWVVFCSTESTLPHEWLVQMVPHQDGWSGFWRTLAKAQGWQSLKLFAQPKRVGHSVVDVHFGADGTETLGERDLAYDALRKVLAACEASRHEYRGNKPDSLIGALPIIAVSGRLFQAFLGEDGSCEIEEVPMSLVLWESSAATVPVRIVSASALSELASQIKPAAEWIYAEAVRYRAAREGPST
jgi:hypothetical protein